MSRRSLTVFLLILLSLGALAKDSLYHRLGGYDAICAVTDDFLGRLIANPDTHKFFTGASDDTQKRIRQHIVDFLVEKTGGPAVYTGRTLKESHKGLGITDSEWNTTAGLLVETLNKFKVPAPEQKEVLDLVSSVKNDIVEKR